jgi:o-succinylbenzoate synthase
MDYCFEFRPYQLPFSQPLTTNHGIWKVREGIIIRLTNALGNASYGEIAPIPWFGSETLGEALEFCQQLPSRVSHEEILGICDRLPATQFGFGSAWEGLGNPEITPNPLTKGALEIIPPFVRGARGVPLSYLLPTGIAALNAWQTPWQQGYRTFKWKIGVAPIHQELDLFQQLVNLLPSGTKLRLDANGGLNLEQAKLWLGECDRSNVLKNTPHPITPSPTREEGEHESISSPPFLRGAGGNHPTKIEFLEQPLPVDSFRDLLTLADDYQTPIALDESVATLGQLKNCYAQGWRGVFVIKPSIVGYGDRLREFCQNHPIDAVFSSSLETAIGRNHALKLAQELNNPQRALGFGVDRWLEIDQETLIQQLWPGH